MAYWSIRHSGESPCVSAFPVTASTLSIDGILEELESQGVSIKSHNEFNQTWFVRGEGIFVGYVVTTDELIELKRVNRLNLHGIKSLG